jgi:ribosome-associated protein
MLRPAVHAAGPTLRIPDAELEFRASRAGGPGGQHVNTSSTRAEVRWNVRESAAPTPAQRARLLERLGHRLDSTGRIRVTAAGSRSQLANREAATARLLELVARALEVPRARRATRVPRTERRRRLEEKRRRGARKRDRRSPRSDD